MPVTIQPTTLKYKDSNGQFISADCLKGDPGAAVVPMFTNNQDTWSCNMTYAEVSSAVSDGSCVVAKYTGVNGYGYLPLSYATTNYIAFSTSFADVEVSEVGYHTITYYANGTIEFATEFDSYAVEVVRLA